MTDKCSVVKQWKLLSIDPVVCLYFYESNLNTTFHQQSMYLMNYSFSREQTRMFIYVSNKWNNWSTVKETCLNGSIFDDNHFDFHPMISYSFTMKRVCSKNSIEIYAILFSKYHFQETFEWCHPLSFLVYWVTYNL